MTAVKGGGDVEWRPRGSTPSRGQPDRALLAELSEARQARDDFLSVASHELREPLQALSLRLDVLLDDARRLGSEPAWLVPGLQGVSRHVEQLSRLLDCLLDASRMTRAPLRLDLEFFDLSELVLDVLERFGEAMLRGGARPDVQVEPAVVGRWDQLRIEQVVGNLITNAVKHGAGSPIRVWLGTDGRRATLLVRDQGPGITEADQQLIFERFFRAAPKGISGLGLGLYIARQIVEAHEGRIHVESIPGQGATFVVDLPLIPESADEGGRG